jgi:hypothetical protein
MRATLSLVSLGIYAFSTKPKPSQLSTIFFPSHKQHLLSWIKCAVTCVTFFSWSTLHAQIYYPIQRLKVSPIQPIKIKPILTGRHATTHRPTFFAIEPLSHTPSLSSLGLHFSPLSGQITGQIFSDVLGSAPESLRYVIIAREPSGKTLHVNITLEIAQRNL